MSQGVRCRFINGGGTTEIDYKAFVKNILVRKSKGNRINENLFVLPSNFFSTHDEPDGEDQGRWATGRNDLQRLQ